VLIAGAGPAGLYLAYLLKRQRPADHIEVIEQNPSDSTFGFGVVFSDRALDFLRDDDAATHGLIVPAMKRWHDLTLHHRGQRITIDGIGFAAIGRLQLLQLLQQRLSSVGVEPRYRTTLTQPGQWQDFDLVVAADGANSIVRSSQQAQFGTQIEPLANHFVWYGTTQHFDTLSQTFIETEHGRMNAHHYRYAEDMSTFIVECDPATWRRAGFAEMDEGAARRYNERAFAETLGGHGLLTNRSIWRHFPKIQNRHWSVGNCVLVGDALRTAHFSIGSGTRLAFEDVIALARALREHDLANALQAYEAARRPIVDKLVAAANLSADWYEDFAAHMRLDPWALAWSYVQRSGRVDAERLQQVSPRFVAGYRQYLDAQQ
jgi:2-polyprenyl-6-methoxyphenol hydroxylase-like FAD-dependent oxidoreductase